MVTGTRRAWIGRAIFLGCLAEAMIFFARGRWLVAAGLVGLALVQAAMLRPRGRRGYFALAAVAASTALTAALILGLDVYLHHRFARNGGYNVWGYRGEAAGRKPAGQLRLAMLGGSVAFGFGVAVDETIPFYLQQRLNALPGGPPTKVVNLGWNSEGAYALLPTLEDYTYLDYDGAILYSGYNDLARNTQVFRHESAVFRLTGYLPILPIVPIRQWLRVDRLSDTAGAGEKVVFRPNLADRYAAEAADTALRVSQALERELKRLAPADTPAPPPSLDEADEEWVDYCGAVERATRYLVAHGKDAFVVTEPYIDKRHIRQQFALWKMLKTRFADEPKVHYIDMGGVLDLDDRSLCYDGLHLTAAGNARVAGRLASALWEALHRG
jgi:hypothetical protein